MSFSKFPKNRSTVIKSLQHIFSFPHYEDYKRDKQAKFLHLTLQLVLFSGIYFAYTNWWGSTAFAFGVLAATSVYGIYLNRNGHYNMGAVIITAVTIFVLFYNFIDGISLHDAGIIALPIIITFSSFLFGSKSIVPTTAILIAGTLFTVYLERAGYISPTNPTSNKHLINIDILVIIAGIFQRTILGYWEGALEKAQTSEQNIKEAYLRTLEGWAKTLEFHDRETEGHSRRVTAMSLKLAEAAGIYDEQELEHIRWGALLHDIGKIAISDQILKKKEPLTEAEMAEIRKHPEKAKELISNIPFLLPILPIPIAHHEHWDGLGYPYGLSKDAIPLQARIFSVVDNWDALTSDRPYRKAWSKEDTKNFIKQQAGKKFDPHIVEIFLEFIDQENLLGGSPTSDPKEQ